MGCINFLSWVHTVEWKLMQMKTHPCQNLFITYPSPANLQFSTNLHIFFFLSNWEISKSKRKKDFRITILFFSYGGRLLFTHFVWTLANENFQNTKNSISTFVCPLSICFNFVNFLSPTILYEINNSNIDQSIIRIARDDWHFQNLF